MKKSRRGPKRKPIPSSTTEFIRIHAGKMTDMEISRRLGISTYKVAVVRREIGVRVRKGRPKMAVKEVNRILGLRRSGVKVVHIARRLRVSRQRIYQVLSRNGGGR
jgi:hypothetical protein